MKMLLVTVVVCAMMGWSRAYPQGPPVEYPNLCEDMNPIVGHNYTAKTDKRFTIEVSNTCWKQGQRIQATVQNINGGTTFMEGIFVQVRQTQEAFGKFESFTGMMNDITPLTCFNKIDSAAGHNKKLPKPTERTFQWLAPSSVTNNEQSDIFFISTVVHETDEFWVNVTSANIRYDASCVEKTSISGVNPIACNISFLLISTGLSLLICSLRN